MYGSLVVSNKSDKGLSGWFVRDESTDYQLQVPLSCMNVICQPETRPIAQEQLVSEAKGIYAGLMMVEAICNEVDSKQATLAASGASNLL